MKEPNSQTKVINFKRSSGNNGIVLHLELELMEGFMRFSLLMSLFFVLACKKEKKDLDQVLTEAVSTEVSYATGFNITNYSKGIKVIIITSPWPNSQTEFRYALVPRDQLKNVDALKTEVDALIPIPVQRLIVTSTTHIPALEALGVTDRLIGFPETKYISSHKTREFIESGNITDLGSNESLNTEMTISLQPDLVIGFGIDNQNKAYQAIESANIPVVYNGDWTEESPLGKAEWIKFFAPFFELETEADSIFRSIESDYINSKKIAQSAKNRPIVISGALYKDIWYVPAGKSWAANFIKDANADYLWKDTKGTGSLSLSLESVLSEASEAEYWISPSQYTSYSEMKEANRHYPVFKPFKEKNIYTFAKTTGKTGGLLYYELAPNRPDIVLKDLIHIFHPELLPEYEPYFFKPLD